ncbi:hypothetical protein OESDEN_04864 [Oesophagostomum dentatum]|uniref:Uncharacterized protein n=1 Tax=Oesophagostomum dentatum TaxID=61180 RepID=A0A0B1THC2_OESDE|nr:hypothetical protein OESDEN_04864 [Oesophagostomum dentatum]
MCDNPLVKEVMLWQRLSSATLIVCVLDTPQSSEARHAALRKALLIRGRYSITSGQTPCIIPLQKSAGYNERTLTGASMYTNHSSSYGFQCNQEDHHASCIISELINAYSAKDVRFLNSSTAIVMTFQKHRVIPKGMILAQETTATASAQYPSKDTVHAQVKRSDAYGLQLHSGCEAMAANGAESVPNRRRGVNAGGH